MADSDVIRELIAPAAMIPACGLLLLSSTARMNTVLARIRAFHSERLNVWRDDQTPGTKAEAVRSLRLEGLERQTDRLLIRAALLRATMIQLFGGVSCNGLAMVLLAAQIVMPETSWLHPTAVGVFVCGVLFVLGAMVTSVLEVVRILETVHYEHNRVVALCGTEPANGSEPGVGHPGMGEGMGL